MQGPLSKKCTHSFFRIQPVARSTREKKKELCCDHRHYIYICSCICVCNVFGRNSTPFSLLWSVPRAGFEKESEYIFLRRPGAAGWIRFINLNQAAGRTKFCLGPDLAHGPDFGHACSRRFKEEECSFMTPTCVGRTEFCACLTITCMETLVSSPFFSPIRVELFCFHQSAFADTCCYKAVGRN